MKACPSLTLSTSLMSSRELMLYGVRVPEILARIVTLSVTRLSSPTQSVRTAVMLASLSSSSSSVTGKYPPYFWIVQVRRSNCGVAFAPIFPPSATGANPVCWLRFL